LRTLNRARVVIFLIDEVDAKGGNRIADIAYVTRDAENAAVLYQVVKERFAISWSDPNKIDLYFSRFAFFRSILF
jgi:hypothetical protein